MKADRVLETCLYAANLEATAEFYREVLGLEEVLQFFPILLYNLLVNGFDQWVLET